MVGAVVDICANSKRYRFSLSAKKGQGRVGEQKK
uniref:Uncharacterized protein n=1 Tax=Anguilla anguilla TaxID=7936 RepID=A0A0E9V2P2_ANGAN